MIADEDGLAPLHPSSKLNTDRAFLQHLHDLGHARPTAGWRAPGRHRPARHAGPGADLPGARAA
jgi:hypothetical protein